MYLRIEIWMNDNIEWSLEGEGSPLQFQQAGIKLRYLFPEEKELQLVFDKDNITTVELSNAIDRIKSSSEKKNIMLCDKNYEKMMMFIYND
ncbi:MAG: hypothetical protein GTN76_00540 [Candidatus Aenigmarchaeota archaeon]|nr:hypothetical protein [Candidatus Aenigmarchaeota archaeon]